MSHQLTFTTDSIDVCINNYAPYSFEYYGWTVSDKYVHNEKNPRGSSYAIIISSPLFSDEEELNNYRLSGQDIVNLITTLIPVCGLPSLNSPKFIDFLKDQYIIDYKSAPQGWSTNYDNVLKQLRTDKGTGMFVQFTFMGISRYSTIDSSPLEDIRLMLERYDKLHEEIRFLIHLYYIILTTDNLNVYMLIGKALEIINTMYPFKHNHGKDDKRIKDFFPELTELFQHYTIKDLISLSNNRKETRHYINKKNNLPHDSLTKDERKVLFRCSTCLIMNVIRDKFGLPHEEIFYSK